MAVRPLVHEEPSHETREVMENDEAKFEDAEEQQEGGTRAPRRAQDPKLPSPEEVAQHCLTHTPFRSWCRHCVRGSGQAELHKAALRDPDALPEVHIDYCFMGKRDEAAQPILVARDRDTKMTVSYLVRAKGCADAYVVKRLIAFLKEIGYEGKKVIIRSDQESPIKAVIDKLVELRGDGMVVPEHSPVRSSGSNGIVERAIKEVEMKVRCLKSAIDERL